MLKEKPRRICAIGIFSRNLMVIDDQTLVWIDAKDFNLADLAKLIGIDEYRKVKAKITLEIVEEPCEVCGKLTSGDKLCEKCGKVICDRCAKTDIASRYCQICFRLKDSITSEENLSE